MKSQVERSHGTTSGPLELDIIHAPAAAGTSPVNLLKTITYAAHFEPELLLLRRPGDDRLTVRSLDRLAVDLGR